MTVSQLYEESIKPLPEAERRQLATLILADIVTPPNVDYSEEWSEEDMQDLTTASLRYAQTSFGEDEALV